MQLNTMKETNKFTLDLERLLLENHDECVSCKHRFSLNEITHSGYGEGGVPLYVCDSCASLLTETAARYAYLPLPYSRPDTHSKLWRYMDFTKYLSLLFTQSLHFSRVDLLDDRYEGAKGLRRNKERWDQYCLDFFRDALLNPPDGAVSDLSAEEIEKRALAFISDLEVHGANAKLNNFVSCWHESEHESEAMWKLYSSFLPNAVAVRTTYGHLYRSLDRNPKVKIGRINYIDFKKSYAGVNSAFWHKRTSFEHEREVRALIWDYECKDVGKLVKCDLPTLIQEVFVSPKASRWFVDIVNDVTRRYGLAVTVSNSELAEDAFF